MGNAFIIERYHMIYEVRKFKNSEPLQMFVFLQNFGLVISKKQKY